jgi:hypothetical protein
VKEYTAQDGFAKKETAINKDILNTLAVIQCNQKQLPLNLASISSQCHLQ